METPNTQQEKIPEKGADVEIVYVGMRHGEKSGKELTDLGREITAKKAKESGLSVEDFHMIKPYGSDADDPGDNSYEPRALETAAIYADTIAEGNPEKKGSTRKRKILSFETFKNPEPFDLSVFYRKQLPKNFEELSDADKKIAAKQAQVTMMQKLFDLLEPENEDIESKKAAEAYLKEAAGAAAYQIQHLAKLTKKMKSGSRVLTPSGFHGVTPAPLMKFALVRVTKDGDIKEGFDSLQKFGGDFDPSEAFIARICTNEKGKLRRMNVTFADAEKRPQDPDMYFDLDKIKQLADYYGELHKDELKDRGVLVR